MNVEPFTFIVMLALVKTVTEALMLVAADVVVLTEPKPALRKSVVLLVPESAKVSCCPAVGTMVILPARMPPALPDGAEIVRSFGPRPELIMTNAAPVIVGCGLPPNVSWGVLIVSEGVISCTLRAFTITEPPVACALKLTEPPDPASKVSLPLKLSALAPEAESVIVFAPVPAADILPVPVTVRAPVLRI